MEVPGFVTRTWSCHREECFFVISSTGQGMICKLTVAYLDISSQDAHHNFNVCATAILDALYVHTYVVLRPTIRPVEYKKSS